eukprot:365044-Chlamydomonas_euryale.AAC.5
MRTPGATAPARAPSSSCCAATAACSAAVTLAAAIAAVLRVVPTMGSATSLRGFACLLPPPLPPEPSPRNRCTRVK